MSDEKVERWTIYSRPDWDDSVFGPPTGKDGVEVVPASALARVEAERDRLAGANVNRADQISRLGGARDQALARAEKAEAGRDEESRKAAQWLGVAKHYESRIEAVREWAEEVATEKPRGADESARLVARELLSLLDKKEIEHTIVREGETAHDALVRKGWSEPPSTGDGLSGSHATDKSAVGEAGRIADSTAPAESPEDKQTMEVIE